MRREIVVALALTAAPLIAQDPPAVAPLRRAPAPWHWHSWSDGPGNTITIGVGVNTAVFGMRYAHTLGDSPLSVGVGAGTAGYSPYVEVSAPFEPMIGAFPYLGVGMLVSWDPRHNRTTPILEIGGRAWLGRSHRFFTDAGFGAAPARADLAVWAMVFPHLQIGMAF